MKSLRKRRKGDGGEAGPANENAGAMRWMLTYLDMVTLLFGIFVLLYAMSNVDQKKFEQVAASIERALRTGYTFMGGNMSGKESTLPDFYPQNLVKEGDPAQKIFENIQNLLINETRKGMVKITQENRGIVVTLGGDVFFASGSVEFSGDESVRAALEKISGFLAEIPNEIAIEGHTDSIPYFPETAIPNTYRNNWELSAGRATSILGAILDYNQIDPGRFYVAGYGDTKPRVNNDTPEGRAYNRRVDITILRDPGIPQK
jgi:chemotaxis protein MotB